MGSEELVDMMRAMVGKIGKMNNYMRGKRGGSHCILSTAILVARPTQGFMQGVKCEDPVYAPRLTLSH